MASGGRKDVAWGPERWMQAHIGPSGPEGVQALPAPRSRGFRGGGELMKRHVRWRERSRGARGRVARREPSALRPRSWSRSVSSTCQGPGWVPRGLWAQPQAGLNRAGWCWGLLRDGATLPSQLGHPPPRSPRCPGPGQRPPYLGRAFLGHLPKATVGPPRSGCSGIRHVLQDTR